MNNIEDFEIRDGVLIKYLGKDDKVTVPSGVIKIANKAFALSGVKEIVLPEGLIGIEGEYHPGDVLGTFGAFHLCIYLEKVSLPKTLERIGAAAFSGCKRLKHIRLPEKLVEIGAISFADCVGLEEVEFPKGLAKIGEFAFQRCSSLKKIDIQNHECQIDRCAFCESGVTEAAIPAKYGLTSIFHKCKELKRVTITTELMPDVYPKNVINADGTREIVGYYDTTISFGEVNKDFILYAPQCSIDQIEKSIKKQALCGIVELLNSGAEIDEAILNDYIKYAKRQAKQIAPLALENEDLLAFMIERKLISAKNAEFFIGEAQKIENPAITAMLLDYKGRTFGEKDYEKIEKEEERKVRKEIRNASLKGNTEEYNNKFFTTTERAVSQGQYQIKRYTGKDSEVVFPLTVKNKKITGIAERSGSAGDSYKGLERIVIPEGYTTIGKKAFKGCVNLKEVVLPTSLQFIEEEAFADCPNLTSIILPINMRSLGNKAFSNSGLETVYVKSATVSQLGNMGKWYAKCPLQAVYIVDGNTRLDVPKKYRKSLPEDMMLPLEKLFLFMQLHKMGGLIDMETNRIYDIYHKFILDDEICGEINADSEAPVLLELDPSNTNARVITEAGRCIASIEMKEIIEAANDVIGNGQYILSEGKMEPNYNYLGQITDPHDKKIRFSLKIVR